MPTTDLPPVFVLLALERGARAFLRQDGQWKPQPIAGESWLAYDHATCLEHALQTFADGFRPASWWPQLEVAVVYEVATARYLERLSSLLVRLRGGGWQILQWEHLCGAALQLQRIPTETVAQNDAWLCTVALPLMAAGYQAGQFSQQREAEQYHQGLMDNFEAERQQLRQALEAESRKLAEVRSHLAASERLDLPDALRFLPAIFPRFWEKVAPTDLALLLNIHTPPIIPNPYPVPSLETVMLLKTELLNLPPKTREQILHLASGFMTQFSLVPHGEMAPLIDDHLHY